MTLRSHPMRPEDVAPCTEIIAAHPVIGARYGSKIRDLSSAWRRLLKSEAFKAAVFEEVTGNRVRIWGVGVAVFVRGDFMRRIKAPPLFWFGPELATLVAQENSPVLSDKEVQQANSSGGINLLVWEALCSPGVPQGLRLMTDVFLEMHRGYRLKEAITAQSENGERLRWAMDAGGMLWDPTEQCLRAAWDENEGS